MVVDVAPVKKLGFMKIMGPQGDEKMTWDQNDDVQVKKARDKFNEMLKDGKYRAYVSKDIAGQRKGEEVFEFPRTAERLIMVPDFVGG